jgi:hypothetical protein
VITPHQLLHLRRSLTTHAMPRTLRMPVSVTLSHSPATSFATRRRLAANRHNSLTTSALAPQQHDLTYVYTCDSYTCTCKNGFNFPNRALRKTSRRMFVIGSEASLSQKIREFA